MRAALLLVAACGAAAPIVARKPAPILATKPPPRPTLAEEILEVESPIVPTTPQMHALLSRLTAEVKAKLPTQAMPERLRALKILGIIEDVLAAEHFVYPGIGYVDKLHDGLAEVQVDPRGLAELLARQENHLRLDQIASAPHAAFHMADCDIFSMIYMSIGGELGLPIAMLEVPAGDAEIGHAYVVWTLSDGSLVRWEADEGMERDFSIDAEHYSPPLDLDRAVAQRAYGMAQTRDELLGSTHYYVGLDWAERGAFAKAIAEYKRAIALAPHWPNVYNELSWLLATSSDPAIRDPKAAIEVGEQLVKIWPSANHIDTLAAAYAADAQWSVAIEVEKRALAASHFGDPNLADYVARMASLKHCVPYLGGRANELAATHWKGSLHDLGWGRLSLRSSDAAEQPPMPDLCPKDGNVGGR